MTPPLWQKAKNQRTSWRKWKRRLKKWLKTQHSKNKDHDIQSYDFMANRWGKMKTVTDFIFLGSKITVDGDCSHEIKRLLLLGRKAMTNLDSIKKQRPHFASKSLHSQSCGFPSSHVWMWELDLKEGWVPKNWHYLIVGLEKTLQSPLDRKEIRTINFKGSQPWIFTGRSVAEAEASIIWPLDMKPTHWEKPWCWERLKAKGEGGGRGWYG